VLLRCVALRQPLWVAPQALAVLPPLSRIALGWHFHRVEAAGLPDGAAIRVTFEAGHYVISSPWLDAPVREANVVRAAGNLAVDLIEAYLAERSPCLGLHCGAALIGGRLVIFPNHSHGGKSTLMAGLAAAGVPVFCDDVLPLTAPDNDHGVALGIATRLRLPLPVCAPDRLQTLLADSALPAGEGHAYLDLSPPLRPCLGTRARLGAIVLLDRRPAGQAYLHAAAPGDGLQELILQNLSPHARAGEALKRLHPLMQRLPCLRLTYADLAEAVALLIQHFGDDSAFVPPQPADSSTPAEPGPSRRRARRSGGAYQRAPDISVFPTVDGAFLANAQGNEVFRLDPLGRGLWDLLDTALSRDEAVAIIAGAFPEVPPKQIQDDVTCFFEALSVRQLIVAHRAPSPPRTCNDPNSPARRRPR
jgi:hypothetical protein